MKPLYIFDLDGTIALCNNRQHFIQGESPDWRAFYAACDEDKPNYSVIHTMDRLWSSGADIYIFSGRSDEVRDKTLTWLTDHTPFEGLELETMLVMRKAGDYRADDVLKREFYDNMLFDDRCRIVAVFDDRDRVVKMWRDLGLVCFQVVPGEF